MPDWLPASWAMTGWGLFGGLGLGLAARLGGFCTLRAVEDALYAARFQKLAMWLWALGLAIGTIAVAKSFAFIDVTTSIYATSPASLISIVLGGLMFGYGMALAGTCGYTALARFGSGDLRAFIILLVIGISAYISIAGPLADIRIALTGDVTESQFIDSMLAALLEISPLWIGLGIAICLIIGAWMCGIGKGGYSPVLWSSVVAIAIASGWLVTSYEVAYGFELNAAFSHSYSAPIGQSLLYLMTSTGSEPGFAIGSVLGVVLGSLIGSVWRNQFIFDACDDPRELGRQLFGAFLMGTGAVWAMGCSIGQGLTAMSLLYWSAPITLAAIVLGAVIGIKQLIHGSSWFR